VLNEHTINFLRGRTTLIYLCDDAATSVTGDRGINFLLLLKGDLIISQSKFRNKGKIKREADIFPPSIAIE